MSGMTRGTGPLTERAWEVTQDLWHWLLRRPPLWDDTYRCGRRLCRFCGGRWGR